MYIFTNQVRAMFINQIMIAINIIIERVRAVSIKRTRKTSH